MILDWNRLFSVYFKHGEWINYKMEIIFRNPHKIRGRTKLEGLRYTVKILRQKRLRNKYVTSRDISMASYFRRAGREGYFYNGGCLAFTVFVLYGWHFCHVFVTLCELLNTRLLGESFSPPPTCAHSWCCVFIRDHRSEIYQEPMPVPVLE